MYQLGLIGYPVEHSLSPWIHRHLLEQSGLAGDYRLFEIKPEDSFAEKIQKVKNVVDGFNVTVPYKQKIIPYLDELDEVAEEMQAVNTVLFKDGKWIGYNTDGIGYLRSLKKAYPAIFEQKEANILIIGAGGAARAIYYALIKEGFQSIDIANRTLEKAEDIADLGGLTSRTTIYSIEEIEEHLVQYDVIIQTTSIGMKSVNLNPVVTIKQLKEGAIVSDIVYQPIETTLLKDAKESQANVLYGHTMLLYQAQAAFEIWTHERVDVTKMEKELLKVLKGR